MSWNTPNGGMRFMDLTRTSPVPIVPGDEIQCRTHPNNKTITNFFHRGYGGIPENLIINICAWIILVLSFCFARRYFGNYGRIGLIDGVRKRSTYHGPTTYEGWSTTVCSEPAPTGDSHELETSQVSHTNDEGMFTWVWSTVQLSDSQISSRCGSDALHYLKFQRALILLMIVFTFLSLSIALPVNMSGTKIDKEVNPFAVTTLSNLDPGSWLVVIHITLSLLFFVIGIYVMRKYSVGLRLKESGSYISKTLMITNVPLNMCNEDTLRSHFNQAYPDKRVEDLKVSHDTEKVADLEKKKKAVSEALAYVNKYNRNNKPMKMRPWKCGFLCSHLDCCDCCETVDARSHYQNEEGSLSRKLHWAKRKARDNPLGIFFVTFGTPEDAQKVLKDHTLRRRGNGISITKNPGRSELSTALNPKDWKVKFAPPAADIYWEHLRTNGKFWLLRWVVIHIILLLFLIFFSTPSVVINNLDFVLLPLKQELGKINPLFSEFLATILLLSTAALLPVLISLSDRFLSHWTRSDANMSVMVKTFIFLLFMVLLLPSLGLVR
ncbi:hypothetical protein QYM36_012617 [Artemia franciscana]|uniref:CSC1-like protein 2 n=1 Tax=Artemia franciscana TaxID=6661 RepID=A0AA88HVA4_ARTSF|nr:hypothetical protein QYM36_012617 [Artemia franciscana]